MSARMSEAEESCGSRTRIHWLIDELFGPMRDWLAVGFVFVVVVFFALFIWFWIECLFVCAQNVKFSVPFKSIYIPAPFSASVVFGLNILRIQKSRTRKIIGDIIVVHLKLNQFLINIQTEEKKNGRRTLVAVVKIVPQREWKKKEERNEEKSCRRLALISRLRPKTIGHCLSYVPLTWPRWRAFSFSRPSIYFFLLIRRCPCHLCAPSQRQRQRRWPVNLSLTIMFLVRSI